MELPLGARMHLQGTPTLHETRAPAHTNTAHNLAVARSKRE
jgi:hypothetical protein